MEPDVTWEQIDRYLAGALPTEAARELEGHLAMNAEARRALKSLDTLSGNIDTVPMERMWKRTAQRMQPAPDLTPSWPKPHAKQHAKLAANSRSKPYSRLWMGAGAVALMGVIIGAMQFGRFQQIWNSHAATGPYEVATASGELARFTLPDNSTVTLAPNSVLRYARNFGASSGRAVELEGQALFTVTHHSGAPFTIQTGHVATRVLGTSFSVRRYEADTAVQVVVAQGKVSVGKTVLSTGDAAVAATETQVSVTRGNDIAAALSWVDGQLVFAEVPLERVIPEIERWYGVSIEVEDKALLARPVSATIGNESIARAVELVAFNVGARTEQHGTRVVFHLQQGE